jgi:hypothetical protein
MKQILFAIVILLSSNFLTAQSDKEIAGVYLKKAKENYEKLETEKAINNFNKAVKLLDTITKSDQARLGVLIHYELRDYKEAFKYAKWYFKLVKNKRTKDYQQLLELYVDIKDELDKQLADEKRLEAERLKKEKEAQRIASLKNAWQNKLKTMAITADSIYAFDKNNIALYTKSGNYGVVNDKGIVLLEAANYKAAYHFDGYIILMNKAENPTKIYCFNAQKKLSYKLPDISAFNQLSTHYGHIMLPRGNDKLVAYPNNTSKVLVYDLASKTFISFKEQKTLFKALQKKKAISSYNKNGELKVNKKWYRFGGIVGGGIIPLYSKEDYTINGYLCAIDGRKLESSIYNFIGYFYNDKFQASTDGTTFWINQNGTKVEAPVDESGIYKGNTKVDKLDNDKYAFYLLEEGVKTYISGNKKLLNQVDFIKNN